MTTTLDVAATPTERIQAAVEELHDAVSAELLDRVRRMDPTDFERLVVRLMQAMGYGGPGVSLLGLADDTSAQLQSLHSLQGRGVRGRT